MGHDAHNRSARRVMRRARLLVIGGGIGGLTSAIALRAKGYAGDIIERDPDWSVYDVGIIQEANVIRAMKQLGIPATDGSMGLRCVWGPQTTLHPEPDKGLYHAVEL